MNSACDFSPYDFRAACAEDLPLLHRWLETPEVSRWWGDQAEQYSLLEEDLSNPAMRMWIVSLNNAPFAYIQDYDPAAWDVAIPDVPKHARGIDQFIGVPAMIGIGHGSGFIRAHAERLLREGAPAVFTDPEPENARAIRAYAKAGFAQLGIRNLSDGPAMLMARIA